MRINTILAAALVGSTLAACGDADVATGSGASPEPQQQREVVRESAPATPMPKLGARLERVREELGEEYISLAAAIPVANGRLQVSRREALEALSPRARASLRRHNVRIEQLVRQLEGDVQ